MKSSLNVVVTLCRAGAGVPGLPQRGAADATVPPLGLPLLLHAPFPRYKFIKIFIDTSYINYKQNEILFARRRIKTEEKAKGRRFCLGGRIYLIPCCASCFAMDDFE